MSGEGGTRSVGEATLASAYPSTDPSALDRSGWDASTALGPALLDALRELETARDTYLRDRDPIAETRLGWRARVVRNLAHLRPSDRVLEVGAGEGRFTPHLRAVAPVPVGDRMVSVRVDQLASVEGTFDVIVVSGLLDRRTSAPLLTWMFNRLAPGGRLVGFESNPWNPILQLRRLLKGRDPRQLESRARLYEQLSGVGLVNVLAVPTDFVYRPLSPRFIWLLRNLTLVLENSPGVRRLAGAILFTGDKPGLGPEAVPITAHDEFLGAVSAVVPCHNEEQNLGQLVERLVGFYGPYLHQVILVDDNSSDRTASVIEELGRRYPQVVGIHRSPPNGVGLTLRDGYAAATGQWILSLDCDFQHLLPDLADLFAAAAEGHDVVVGSRFSPESVVIGYPAPKIVANRLFHLLARRILRVRFRDLTNNLRLMKREVADRLTFTEAGFAANAEVGLQPVVLGFSVCEVPISWIGRRHDMGASSFHLAQVSGGYRRVLFWLAIWAMTGRGRYRTLRPHGVRRHATARR